MTKFESSIIIRKPVEKVFGFATNLDNNTQWQTDILEARQTSKGPFGLGATYRCVNKFLGRRIETEGFIKEYEPDRHCSYNIISGVITGETRFTFEPVESGTRFTTSGEVDLGFFKLLKSVVVRKALRQLENDLKKLKYILENGS
ncbi:MAG: SRPBCC family protein [Proteobacteria bacterium]|nr:SRPBCC family protein [Pseudomonadota bacterium]